MKLSIGITILSGLVTAEEYHIKGGISTLLAHELGSEENAEMVLNHGCWCSGLNDLQGDRGAPSDKIDRICQQWVKHRRCINVCNSVPEDTMYKRVHNTCMDNEFHGDTEKCCHNTCIVDLYWVRKLKEQVHLLIDGEISLPEDHECGISLDGLNNNDIDEQEEETYHAGPGGMGYAHGLELGRGTPTDDYPDQPQECVQAYQTFQSELTCLIDAGCNACDEEHPNVCKTCHDGYVLSDSGDCVSQVQQETIQEQADEIAQKDLLIKNLEEDCDKKQKEMEELLDQFRVEDGARAILEKAVGNIMEEIANSRRTIEQIYSNMETDLEINDAQVQSVQFFNEV